VGGAGVGVGFGAGAVEAGTLTLLDGATLTSPLTLLDGAPFTPPPPPQEAIVMAEPALIRARVTKLLADENGMFFKIYPCCLGAELLKLHHQIPIGGISRDGLGKLREAHVSFLIMCDRKIARSCRRHSRTENSFRMDRFILRNYRDCQMRVASTSSLLSVHREVVMKGRETNIARARA
jgi:hypothetical protein